MKPDYSYQHGIITKAVELLRQNKSKGIVLAATPGSGKTRMAIAMIGKMIASSHAHKVLVLTHGQTVLRSQFMSALSESKRAFKYAELGFGEADTAVFVGLPQWFITRSPDTDYDLIVVDEAHHFFHGKLVQSVIAANDARLLLLTGSPSKYVADGGYDIVSITASELATRGVLVDPHIELCQTSLPFRLKDLNEYAELPDTVEFTRSDVATALDSAISKLMSSKRLDTNKLGKTMIVCHSQRQARLVSSYLSDTNVNHVVSTSDVDEESTNIKLFKEDNGLRVLVVVNRAVLGFDFDRLQTVIDLTCSHNPDRIFQLMCRVVRNPKSGKATNKTYIKITPVDLAPLTYVVMSFCVALSLPEYYTTYSGNWRNTDIPVSAEFVDVINEAKRKGSTGDRPVMVDLPRLLTMVDISPGTSGHVKPIAYTNFSIVRQRLYSSSSANLDKAEIMNVARLGLPRPAGSNRLGNRLVKFTSKNSTEYDADFDREIRSLVPSWFTKSTDINKSKLLELAKSGASKPSSSNNQTLARSLKLYTTQSSGVYDADFDRMIRSIAPTWFVKKDFGSANNVKAELVRRALAGMPKPSFSREPRLAQCLFNYTHKKSNGRTYDEEFVAKIRSIAPVWVMTRKERKAAGLSAN